MNLIHYIIVRRDLPLGTMAAMVTHAAGESGALYQDPYDGRFRGATAVVLEAEDRDDLLDAADYLDTQGVQYVVVLESSPPYDGQAMAIGIVPEDRAVLGPIMKDFKTLKTLDNPDETT